MNLDKYDRQIRLFGLSTQESISKATVQVLGTGNLVSAEIIKNLTLLGVKKIFVGQKELEACGRIVPNKLLEINDNLTIEISEKVEKSDFVFLVDVYKPEVKGYFICSKCFTIGMIPYEHKCEEGESICREACECLIGALAVQEFIKKLQGKPSLQEYRLRI